MSLSPEPQSAASLHTVHSLVYYGVSVVRAQWESRNCWRLQVKLRLTEQIYQRSSIIGRNNESD